MSQDPPPSPETSKSKKSCLWAGLKFGFWSFVVLLLGVLIFHQPLLRLALNHGGKYFAKKAGLIADYQISGSVWSDLGLQAVEVKGEKGPLRHVVWEKLELEYDWRAFLATGLSGVLNAIRLQQAEVHLDLRSNSNITKEKKQTKQKREAGFPELWVNQLDLQGIHVRLQMDNGDILIQGLTFQLFPNKTGILHIEELVIPSAKLHLTQVRGRTELQGRAVVLKELTVRPGVFIHQLVADLSKLSEGLLPYGLELSSGYGSLTSAGTLWLGGGKFGFDAILALQSITETDVSAWTSLPRGLKWQVQHGALIAKGYPTEPRGLDFSLWLQGKDVEVANQTIDTLSLIASSQFGQTKIHDLITEICGNHLAIKAEAELPTKWVEMKQVATKLDWHLVAPALQSIRPELPVDGNLLARGKTTLDRGKLVEADAYVELSPLRFSNTAQPSLPPLFVQAQLRTDADILHLEQLHGWIDQRHEIHLSGSLELSEAQRAQLTWSLQLPEAGRWVPESIWKRGGSPIMAALTGSGQAQMELPALKAKDWSKLEATTSLELNDLDWTDAQLEHLKLQAKVSQGKIELHELTLNLDKENHLSAHGEAPLDRKESAPFKLQITSQFKQFRALNAWLQVAGREGLSFESGQMHLDWKTAGQLDAFEHVKGGGRVQLQEVKIAGQKDPLNLLFEASHDGLNAEVATFVAEAGALHAKGSLKLNAQQLQIHQLTMSSGDLKLLDLVAEIPLALDQNPRPKIPLRKEDPWKVNVIMNQMDVDTLFKTFGIAAPVKGILNGSLSIGGTPDKPNAQLLLDLKEVTSDALDGKLSNKATITLKTLLQDEQLRLSMNIDQAPLKTLSLALTMPFQLEAIIDHPNSVMEVPLEGSLSLPASEIDFAKSFAPMITTLDGEVMSDVKISGTPREPKWDGQLKIDVSDLAVQNAPMDFKEIKLHLGFEQKVVKLQEVSASIAGGSARVNGQILFENITSPEFDLELLATEALLMRDEAMSLRTDGHLHCRGTIKKAALSGSLELVRGRVFKEIEFLPLSLPNQLPPPPPAVKRSTQKLQLPSILHDWTFDVTVKTRDPIRLLGNVLNGGVIVDMAARGTGASPELSGRASLKDARLRLPFSRLNITKGEVIFEKEHPFDPQLDLQGDSFINNYQVSLSAYGPALDPKLRFSSSPPLSEGEIATLLATGATSGDLRSSEGLAANRAAFLLISQTYRKMFRKTAPNRYDEEPPKLSFNFSPLSTGGSQRSVSATYELSPKLQAVGIISESGSFRGLLYYLVRFR